MVITFCFYHFLIGRLLGEIFTAKVWWKLVKFWRAPTYCWHQYIVTFLHGRPEQCGRESAHKSWPASCNQSLGERKHSQGGEHQRGLEEASYCRLCRAKPVRRCFWACTNILLMLIFLPTPNFYWHLYFVNANICQRLTFVDIYILLLPIFVEVNICRPQCFVDVNILLTSYLLDLLLMIVLCIYHDYY